MGLDGVELIIDVEEHFLISLPDESMPRIKTLGDFYETILHEISITPFSKYGNYDECREAVAETLKDDLHRHFGVDPAQVQDEVLLEALIPDEKCHTRWEDLRQSSTLKYPALKFPRWMVRFYTAGIWFWLCVVGASLLFLSVRWLFGNDFQTIPIVRRWIEVIVGFIWIFAGHVVIVPLLANRLLRRFKKSFPSKSSFSTVGGLISELLLLNREQLVEEMGRHRNTEMAVEESLKPVAPTIDTVCGEFRTKARLTFMKELSLVLNRPVETIRDDQPIRPLFSGRAGRARLRRLYANSELILPTRKYPAWTDIGVGFAAFIAIVCMASLIVSAAILSVSSGWYLGFIAIFSCYGMTASAIVALTILLFRFLFLSKRVPDEYVTVEKLTDWVAEKSARSYSLAWKQDHPHEVTTRLTDHDKTEIWRDLCRIVAKLVNLDEKELTPETDLIRLLS